RSHDLLNGVGKGRDAIAYKASEMILDRNAANFGEVLVDAQVAAIRRETDQANRGGIVNELKRRLMRKQHDIRLMLGLCGTRMVRAIRHDRPHCGEIEISAQHTD